MDNVNGVKLYPKKSKKPLKAIRLMCLECMGMSRTEKNPEKPFKEVNECTSCECPLYDFRFGRNPFHSRARKADRAQRIVSESLTMH